MYTIRQVTLDDLEAVTALESRCFPPEEAATRESFLYRIQTFPESFYVAEENNRIIALINGCCSNQGEISDRLFHPEGGHDPQGQHQMIFGLATTPEKRHQGIASTLMKSFIENARRRGKRKMILTCKEEKIPYYEKFGYVNNGVSQSVHGGSIWYDMVLDLS